MPAFAKWGIGLAAAAIAAVLVFVMMPERRIVLASATTATGSGLLPYLLTAFTQETGIEVQVIPAGTSTALDFARKGEVDVVLGHDPDAHFEFMVEGFGADLREVMYDDFV